MCTMEDTAGYFAPRPRHSQVMESLEASSDQTHEGAEEVDKHQGPLHRGPESSKSPSEEMGNVSEIKRPLSG